MEGFGIAAFVTRQGWRINRKIFGPRSIWLPPRPQRAYTIRLLWWLTSFGPSHQTRDGLKTSEPSHSVNQPAISLQWDSPKIGKTGRSGCSERSDMQVARLSVSVSA